ncbi:hypothetical protein ACFL9T_10130 [Thermodesulfobacteriota bacterium]
MKRNEDKIDRPKIIVIGQQQRCGGSLMVRLFDGHRQVAVHPHENYFGRPYKYHLPQFDIEQPPEIVWRNIFEPQMLAISRLKVGEGGYPLAYDFQCHKQLFVEKYPETPNYKDICLHYLDCLFRATHNSYDLSQIKYYLFFTPRHALYADDILNIFDGSHVIQLIRNPVGFFNSVKSHNRFYDLDSAKFVWRLFFFNVLYCAGKGLSNYHPIIFEDMLVDPACCLEGLFKQIDIHFNDDVLAPTFGGRAWSGDSHFKKLKGIDKEVAYHYKKYLNSEETAFFDEEVVLYERLREKIGRKKDLAKWDEEEVINGLAKFESFLSIYKFEKPINTKGFIFHPEGQKLYSAIIGNRTAELPASFYKISDIDERKLLVRNNELLNNYYPKNIPSLPSQTNNSKLFDENVYAQLFIGIINVYGLQIGESFILKYFHSGFLLRIVDEVIILLRRDPRGLSLKLSFVLFKMILQPGNLSKTQMFHRLMTLLIDKYWSRLLRVCYYPSRIPKNTLCYIRDRFRRL